MIEYVHTMNSPNKITEHRRLNLKLFCILLKDKTYKREKAYWYGLPVGYKWFSLSGKFNWETSKRLEKVRANPPHLKLAG